MGCLLSGLLAIGCAAGADAPPINPFPPPLAVETAGQWTFAQGTEGWSAQNECTLESGDGALRVRSTGNDPYFHRALDVPGGEFSLVLKARSRTAGPGAIFWTTDRSPQRGNDKLAHFEMIHDGAWHEHRVRLRAPGKLTDLRIDPGTAPGEVEIDEIRLVRETPHPLEIERVEVADERVRFTVRNHSEQAQTLSFHGEEHTIEGGGVLAVDRPVAGRRPLEPVTLRIELEGFPPIARTVFLHHPEAAGGAEWVEVPQLGQGEPPVPALVPMQSMGTRDTRGAVKACVTADGSLVHVERDGRLAAICGPLVLVDGELPALKVVDRGPPLRLAGEGIEASLAIDGDVLSVSIHSEKPCEGPVVRVPGALEQGLFAGLEYLGRGELSSSTLDVETDEHLRFAPDPMKVTMPLMAVVTRNEKGDGANLCDDQRCASVPASGPFRQISPVPFFVAVSWDDMTLQPVYAVPNFFDGTADHRMALRGRKIEAFVRVAGGPLEEAILWGVRRRGLPPLPEPPRSRDEQRALCIRALSGPLKSDAGWGHCVEDRWPRRPFADIASTVWRLTGEVPDFPQFVPGGSHIRNESMYFVTGRAGEWLEHHRQAARRIIARQQPDGSFRYQGKYARGHFEDTASGHCARPAAQLLEHAWATGDPEALEAGLRALEYIKRFRTPRGAQVWEVPLHTPDVLASAWLVWAYVRGYELTGRREHLDEARRWALSGVPFVYLWGERPMMRYATIPVYGATNWKAPCWIGRPVQWCGLVYAYGLTLLAPYDDALDWRRLARGILISGQQQQYPDGQYAGLLPDSIDIKTGRRFAWNINPCNLVSLGAALDGRPDHLSVAANGKHRVAAPFPVTIRDGAAHIEGRAGVKYQVVVDGDRVVDVASKGQDVVALE